MAIDVLETSGFMPYIDAELITAKLRKNNCLFMMLLYLNGFVIGLYDYYNDFAQLLNTH
jgi:hypothetical protein